MTDVEAERSHAERGKWGDTNGEKGWARTEKVGFGGEWERANNREEVRGRKERKKTVQEQKEERQRQRARKRDFESSKMESVYF